MTRTLRIRLLGITLTALALAGGANAAHADWITIKNDTDRVIVVQETCVCNGVVKRGKPTRLLPGETVREFFTLPMTKRVEIFEGRNPVRPVFTGDLKCVSDQQVFTVVRDGRTVGVTTPVARASAEPMPPMAKK